MSRQRNQPLDHFQWHIRSGHWKQIVRAIQALIASRLIVLWMQTFKDLWRLEMFIATMFKIRNRVKQPWRTQTSKIGARQQMGRWFEIVNRQRMIATVTTFALRWRDKFQSRQFWRMASAHRTRLSGFAVTAVLKIHHKNTDQTG
jgi:hypothetical protein